MIKTTAILIEELSNYKAPANRISRLVKYGTYIPIVKGLYETDKTTPGYLLAGSIYGPSYLSFDYALSHYGLIPEAVYSFTSATFEKKKAKKYETPFGNFLYRDVPALAYPLGVTLVKEGSYVYQIAIPEKAVCDKLYMMPPVNNKKDLQDLIFEDLRIDEREFYGLNGDYLLELSELYHCTNTKMLGRLLR